MSQKLILIDHDGTLCQTQPQAYDSLYFALNEACRATNTESIPTSGEFREILTDTSGTTEKYLVEILSNQLRITNTLRPLFESRFYAGRANYYQNLRNYGEFTGDTYYPDCEWIIERAKNLEHITMLVTGNPSATMKQRLSRHMAPFFMDDKGSLLGSFGEEAMSRKELIELAINRAIKLGFEPIKNFTGFYDNIYYIGDRDYDFFAGIQARVKTIWIASRSIQEAYQKRALGYVKCFDSLFPNCLLIANDLESEEVQAFL